MGLCVQGQETAMGASVKMKAKAWHNTCSRGQTLPTACLWDPFPIVTVMSLRQGLPVLPRLATSRVLLVLAA